MNDINAFITKTEVASALILTDFSDTQFQRAYMWISGPYPMKVLYPQEIMDTYPAGQGYFQ
jgi:hypothetical protein